MYLVSSPVCVSSTTVIAMSYSQSNTETLRRIYRELLMKPSRSLLCKQSGTQSISLLQDSSQDSGPVSGSSRA